MHETSTSCSVTNLSSPTFKEQRTSPSKEYNIITKRPETGFKFGFGIGCTFPEYKVLQGHRVNPVTTGVQWCTRKKITPPSRSGTFRFFTGSCTETVGRGTMKSLTITFFRSIRSVSSKRDARRFLVKMNKIKLNKNQ